MKYKYFYCVFKNNMRDGLQFVKAFKNLSEALLHRESLEADGGGACDVVKKRIYKGENKPRNGFIYENYKYNYFDFWRVV